MASKRNKQHKLRMKKRGDNPKNKKILRRLKAKPYTQRTTKRRYNNSKR
jgi:hypothetical protein